MSDPGVPYQGDFEVDDEDDDFELGFDNDECMLMPDGQCMAAGSEYCDFECPHRDSECFAGSKAWMKANGSRCSSCGIELDDGLEPGHPRQCAAHSNSTPTT